MTALEIVQQNVTKASGYNPPSSSLFVDPATNRVASSPWTYDANGNATYVPGSGMIAYDWANRVTAVGSETYGYDPGNKRLWKNSALTLWGGHGERVGTYELMFLQEYNGNGGYNYRLKFKMLATDRYFAGRKLQYEDRLGSKDPWNGYYPYGEGISSASQGVGDKFATYHRDGTGLDYADQRYYHATSGRFVSVDTVIGDAQHQPTRWNRYSYSVSDPVNYVDPDGRVPLSWIIALLRHPGDSVTVTADLGGLSLAMLAGGPLAQQALDMLDTGGALETLQVLIPSTADHAFDALIGLRNFADDSLSCQHVFESLGITQERIRDIASQTGIFTFVARIWCN